MSIPTDLSELCNVIRARYAATAIVATDETASAATCRSPEATEGGSCGCQ